MGPFVRRISILQTQANRAVKESRPRSYRAKVANRATSQYLMIT